MYMLHPYRLTGTNTSTTGRQNSSVAVDSAVVLLPPQVNMLFTAPCNVIVPLQSVQSPCQHYAMCLNGCLNDRLCWLVNHISCV